MPALSPVEGPVVGPSTGLRMDSVEGPIDASHITYTFANHQS